MAAAAVKVTDKVNNAEVDTLDGKTTGKVTVDILEDTFAEVSALDTLNDADVDISGAAITVTDAVSKANADTLNGFTGGLVTLKSVQDTNANVILIDGMTDSEVLMNTAVVTVTDAVSKAQADTLNGFTNKKVTLNSVEDNYANIQLIKDIGNTAVDMDAADIKVTDTVNLTKVDDLRTDTTGDITLTSVTEDKADLATINGYTDVSLSTANITVSDDVSRGEANTCLLYTSPSPRD